MNEIDDDTRLKLIGLKALATDYNNKISDLVDLASRLCGADRWIRPRRGFHLRQRYHHRTA